MKPLNRVKIRWLIPLFMALALFRPISSSALDLTNNFSWLKLVPPGSWLDSWSFEETNWDSDFGFAPLDYTNIVQVPDWDGNALQVDSTNAAWLTYNIAEYAPGYGEYTNLTLATGSIEFWFVANWESADTNYYGSGPGDFGRFLEVGTWGTNADWWSLYLNPSGTDIYFSSGTNGVRTNYLSAPISWGGSQWHLVVLTFSQSNSFIYLDGQLAASGDGVRYVPSGNFLTNGFAIGSDFATGIQQAHGQFDDLYTYNYQLSTDDVANDYAKIYPELPGSFHLSGGFGPDDEPPGPGGGGSGSGSGDGGGYSPPDYGSNLWVAELGMTNNTLSLLETNTQDGILYELQGCTNLASPNWTSFGFVTGSELTNCTPTIAPVENNGTMFYRVRSWQSIDGIPYWWFDYFGLTNISGEAFSPSGDGWTLLQCFEDGISPTNFLQPPAPQGLTITSFNSTNNTATLSWMLSAGPVIGYIVQTPNGTNIVGSGVDVFTDSSSSSSATYSIQAIYAGGLSAWSPSVSVADFANALSSPPVSANNILSANIVGGPLGSAYLAVSAIPTNTASLELTRFDWLATEFYGDDSYNTNFYIPITNPTNGFYSIPNVMTPPNPYVAVANQVSLDDWYLTALDTNGDEISSSNVIGASYIFPQDNWKNSWVVPPYFDGRVQMKQDLEFLLRAATATNSFQFQDNYSDYSLTFINPLTYVYVGFYVFDESFLGYPIDFDVFKPFEQNYQYLNFAFNTNDLDENGDTTTGVQSQYNYGNYTLALQEPAAYQFQAPVTNGAIIPAVLGTNQTQWLYSYPPGNDNYYLGQIGVYSWFDDDDNFFFGMSNNIPNLFGMPYTSAMISWSNSSDSYVVLPAGGQVENVNGYFYPATAQPEFQNVGYNFWVNPGGNYSIETVYPDESSLPGASEFSTSYTNSMMITSVGNSDYQVVAYAKLAVTNAYPGVYGYLGQYFTNAYQVDDSGNVTTNLAGMLSPYGQFFATEPGQAALVTMPDPDTAQQGTGVVDVIALDVDANHDGTMDFSFTGPDFVNADNPYRFWVNDDQDSGDDGGNGGLSIPGQIQADGVVASDVDFYGNPLYKIHGTRDLVDFFPVYINIGSLFQSNALSAGISYADTNWQFVLSQGDGALRFAYTGLTPMNYTNYLRDTNEAISLADNPLTIQPLTTVSNSGVALSPSFIADIATNNGGIILVEAWEPTTQPLVLTVYHGTNQIAQTSLPLSISEVEQMFRHKNILLNPQANQIADRTNDFEVPNEPPTNDKNFIFVHGYNVNVTQARGWDSDIFKRLYWSGSHAKFYGVTWEAADSQVFDSVTINLQTNIVNAFNTAPLLNTFLNSLSGTNIVAAHSLGNMVVLSALNDYSNQNINTYFMVDAAVALNAIDTTVESNPDMYPSAWTNYNGNLWASDWYGLFPASDYRSTLTWWGRLTNFQNAAIYNFYSSGEEVLRDYPTDPPDYLLGIAAGQLVSLWEGDTGLYTWAWQEKLKGLMPANFLLSSDHGGWQFNPYYSSLTVAEANALTSSELQTNAFFNFASGGLYPFNNDLALETSSGSSYAQANQNRILSDAIPCLTLPVGANPVPRLVPQNGNDENYDEQAAFENGWPADRYTATLYGATAAGEWHHSDIRAVAYTFTYKLFNQMVTLGNLQ